MKIRRKMSARSHRLRCIMEGWSCGGLACVLKGYTHTHTHLSLSPTQRHTHTSRLWVERERESGRTQTQVFTQKTQAEVDPQEGPLGDNNTICMSCGVEIPSTVRHGREKAQKPRQLSRADEIRPVRVGGDRRLSGKVAFQLKNNIDIQMSN